MKKKQPFIPRRIAAAAKEEAEPPAPGRNLLLAAGREKIKINPQADHKRDPFFYTLPPVFSSGGGVTAGPLRSGFA